MRHKLIFIVLLILPSIVIGQDLRKDLEALNEVYKSNKHITTNVIIEIHNSHDSEKAESLMKGLIVRSEENLFRSFNNQTTVLGDGFELHIDEAKKAVRYMERIEAVTLGNDQFVVQLEEQLAKGQIVTWLGKSDGVSSYKVESSDLKTSSEIQMDERGFLKKIINYLDPVVYPQNNKIVVNYQVDIEADIDAELFEEHTYFIKSKKEISLAASLVGYRLIEL